MRVLICGSRAWTNGDEIYAFILSLSSDTVIIHGDCRGVDRLADGYARDFKLEILKFPADWNAGKKAGPMRNRRMLEEGKPDMVVAFHNNISASKGTKDMINQVKMAGLPIKIISESRHIQKARKEEAQ